MYCDLCYFLTDRLGEAVCFTRSFCFRWVKLEEVGECSDSFSASQSDTSSSHSSHHCLPRKDHRASPFCPAQPCPSLLLLWSVLLLQPQHLLEPMQPPPPSLWSPVHHCLLAHPSLQHLFLRLIHLLMAWIIVCLQLILLRSFCRLAWLRWLTSLSSLSSRPELVRPSPPAYQDCPSDDMSSRRVTSLRSY